LSIQTLAELIRVVERHDLPNCLVRKVGSQWTPMSARELVARVRALATTLDAWGIGPGDRVVFYTDGISEAENTTGEMYGEERLYELIESLPRELPAREVIERILSGVRGFLDGVEPADDMTVMVLRVLPPRTP